MDSRHLTGSSNELYVASYFVEQGYPVYWPMHTQSRADFLIEEELNSFKKIQVKTATWSETKPYEYLQCRMEGKNKYGRIYKEGDYDYVVFVDKPRLWLATFDEVKGLVSVCLDGTKEGYKSRSLLYDPNSWRIL